MGRSFNRAALRCYVCNKSAQWVKHEPSAGTCAVSQHQQLDGSGKIGYSQGSPEGDELLGRDYRVLNADKEAPPFARATAQPGCQ